MEYLVIIGTIVAAHLLAVMSPGPDFIMAVKNTLQYSKSIGIWTSVGFGAGIFVHISYSLIGLAFIISQSIVLFTIIKILGATYLIYIGYKSLFTGGQEVQVEEEKETKTISAWQAWKIGFLTNVLNPKATLFFLSIFTLVITPETPKLVSAIAGLIMIINTTLWFSLVAIFLSQERIQILYHRFASRINKVFGVILITLGIKIALSK